MTAPRNPGLRSRTLIVAACVACAFLGILGRLTYLQVVKHDEYSRLAESQHAKTVALRPKRGPIVDRGGQVLAGAPHPGPGQPLRRGQAQAVPPRGAGRARPERAGAGIPPGEPAPVPEPRAGR